MPSDDHVGVERNEEHINCLLSCYLFNYENIVNNYRFHSGLDTELMNGNKNKHHLPVGGIETTTLLLATNTLSLGHDNVEGARSIDTRHPVASV